VSERKDRKERFLLASTGIEMLRGSASSTLFLSAPSVHQRIASRLVRQFFDGDAHHSPYSLQQLQCMPPRERLSIFLPRMIAIMPPLPSVDFISWSTVKRAAAAIQSIPLPALLQALEMQSDADATVAISSLAGPLSPAKAPSALPSLKIGDRVRRGPDWEWGNQDNAGEGVVAGELDSNGWLCVQWDSGSKNR
jgi:hypothetical protein